MKESAIKALAKVAKQRITTGIVEDQSTLPTIAKEKERVWQLTMQMHKEEGLVTDPLGRLTVKADYDRLSPIAKERYVLNLSAMYLDALDRLSKQNG